MWTELGKARQYFVFISGNLNLIRENNGTIVYLQVPKTPENPAEEEIFQIGLWLPAVARSCSAEQSEGEIGLTRALRQPWAGKPWSQHPPIHS